jgi:hypothetical protein
MVGWRVAEKVAWRVGMMVALTVGQLAMKMADLKVVRSDTW